MEMKQFLAELKKLSFNFCEKGNPAVNLHVFFNQLTGQLET